MNKFSLKEYASDKRIMSFLCTCKDCNNKMTSYVSPDAWLKLAYEIFGQDEITSKEFKTLNHLAVTKWNYFVEKVSA